MVIMKVIVMLQNREEGVVVIVVILKLGVRMGFVRIILASLWIFRLRKR